MDATLETRETRKPAPALPMAEAFFASAVNSGSLAHAYVLKGKATGALYNLALQIAKVMNCSQPPAPEDTTSTGLSQLACGECKNCRWIEQNAHPAILTISRFTYQVNDKERPELLSTEELEKMAQKANWPTMIKTDQIGHLIYQLGLSSDAVRVVIFTDAAELPASFISDIPAPCEWKSLEATQDRSFHIRPLQRHIFNAFSVNRFLKTLEEPPPRTLFFFITETEEQLLETIVSRCQVVPCLSCETFDGSQNMPAEYQAFLDGFLGRFRQNADAYALGAEFESFFVQEQGLSFGQALEIFQLYIRQRFLVNQMPEDQAGFDVYRSIQREIDQTLRMLASKTNEGQSLLNLFLSLEPYLKA